MSKPKILVFASGSQEGGGSGFEKLVLAARDGLLNAEIVGVVSNVENGGVRTRSIKLGIPFIYFPKPRSAEEYQHLTSGSGADFFALSGWLKIVKGLDLDTRFNSKTVFNIHPGPLPRFGGLGLYGHHVHEAVLGAFRKKEITHTAVSMHFVTSEYDRGPVFFQLNIAIEEDDSSDSIGSRVNQWEHKYQSLITNMVVNGLIHWDGVHPHTLHFPSGYTVERFV